MKREKMICWKRADIFNRTRIRSDDKERRVRLSPFAISIFSQKTRCANKLPKLVTVHYFCATKFSHRLIWIKNKFCVRILPPHFSCVCNVMCVLFAFLFERMRWSIWIQNKQLGTETEKNKKNKGKCHTQIFHRFFFSFIYQLSRMIGWVCFS